TRRSRGGSPRLPAGTRPGPPARCRTRRPTGPAEGLRGVSWASPVSSLQAPDADTAELHPRAVVMVLQPDMPAPRPADVALQPGDGRAVEQDRNVQAKRRDLEDVPVAGRTRGHHLGRRQPVDGPGAVERAAETLLLRIVSPIVDLDLVTVRHRKPPIGVRMRRPERRKTKEDPGVVLRRRSAPLDP